MQWKKVQQHSVLKVDQEMARDGRIRKRGSTRLGKGNGIGEVADLPRPPPSMGVGGTLSPVAVSPYVLAGDGPCGEGCLPLALEVSGSR